MVKSLITGPGFVASHMADLLLEKGEEVHITYRWTDNCDSFKHIKDKVIWHLMDLNDLSSCLKVIEKVKPNYIFHLGAQSYVPASFDYPAETLRTNIIGTYNLLEAVRIIRNSLLQWSEDTGEIHQYDPIIHVCSSSEVYGLVEEKDIPIKEECRFNPSNPYAVSKVGEDMIALMYYTNYGLKVIRTRMFTHFAPRRVMKSAEVNFACQIAEIEAGLKEPILYHGNLNSVRTLADARDACEAYYQLVRKCKSGEVYNIGGDTVMKIGEVLDCLISLSPLKDKIVKQLDKSLLRLCDVTLQIPDCSKFKKETGWKPKHDVKQTLKDLLNWYREEIKNGKRF